jgi:hypothetical protein
MGAGKPSLLPVLAEGFAFELYKGSAVVGATKASLVSKDVAALEVFRFAWFAVRTALGFIALILAGYAALWLFVKILSMNPGSADPDAALRRVKLYNAHPPTPGAITVPRIGQRSNPLQQVPRQQNLQ